MSKRTPEIYIIGTMKGGTTILFDYITSHPNVVAGANKETHYFSLFAHYGIDWYVDQFPDRGEGIFSIDASPTYFDTASMPTIPSYIKQFSPDSSIILIVRDPIERAISHFEHLRLVSHKDTFNNVDINEFFSRSLDRCFVRNESSDALLSQVLEFSVYDYKFTNYVNIYGRDRILVLTTEELRANPHAVMRRVFEHCGLTWVQSDIFGTERYVSGSRSIRLHPEVHARLAALFYPSYERFCRRAGLNSSWR